MAWIYDKLQFALLQNDIKHNVKHASPGGLWIGLQVEGDTGKWGWIGTDDVTPTEVFLNSMWDIREPTGRSIDHCGVMSTGSLKLHDG